MDDDQLQKLQDLFDDKYQRQLGMTYQQWLVTAPDTEDEAYKRLQELNTKIEQLLDVRDAANGNARDAIEDEMDRLRTEYALIEELFGLELDDE